MYEYVSSLSIMHSVGLQCLSLNESYAQENMFIAT